jgi:hypothetical protein
MNVPNQYRSTKQYYRSQFPDWFKEVTVDPVREELVEIKDRLAALEELAGRRRGLF